MTSPRRLHGTSSLVLTVAVPAILGGLSLAGAPQHAAADPARLVQLDPRSPAVPTATSHLGTAHAVAGPTGVTLLLAGGEGTAPEAADGTAADAELVADQLGSSGEPRGDTLSTMRLRTGDELLQFDGASSGRWLVWGGLGPKANIGFWGWGGGQLGFEFFHHFKGHLEGPSLGGLFRMPFGGYGWGGYVAFELGPMFAWNFVLPVDEVHMFIGPRAGLGFGVGVQTWNRCNDGPGNGWDFCDPNDANVRGSEAYPYGWMRFGAQFGVQFPKAKGLVLGVILPEFDVNFGRGVWGSFNFLVMLGGTF